MSPDPRVAMSAYELIPIVEAQRIVLSKATRSTEVSVALSESLGAVLARDVCAREPMPPFPASIMVRGANSLTHPLNT